jgi:hypothetical protein
MRSQTLDQQIDNLRPAVTSGIAATFRYWLIGAAVALAILAAVLWHPIPLMIALFLGIIGIAEKHAGINIVAAIKAYDQYEPTYGQATIWITRWDTDDHYHARLQEAGQPDWEYEFIPQGWQPVEGISAAHIWRSGTSGSKPVLAATAEGIMIPRDTPKQP